MSEILSDIQINEIANHIGQITDPNELWNSCQCMRLIASHRQLQAERDSLKAELAEAKWAHGDFDKPPCFICGYGGAGYYQPSMHPCAEEYHRRKEAQP